MGSAPSSPSPPKQTPTTPTAGGGRDGESPSNGGTYAFPPTIQSEVMGLSGGPRRPRALWTGLAVEAGGGFGAGDFALFARFWAVAGAGEDLEVGDGVEGGSGAAVVGQVEDQAVEAGREAVVEDLRSGRR